MPHVQVNPGNSSFTVASGNANSFGVGSRIDVYDGDQLLLLGTVNITAVREVSAQDLAISIHFLQILTQHCSIFIQAHLAAHARTCCPLCCHSNDAHDTLFIRPAMYSPASSHGVLAAFGKTFERQLDVWPVPHRASCLVAAKILMQKLCFGLQQSCPLFSTSAPSLIDLCDNCLWRLTVQVPNPLPKAMRSRVVPNKNLAGTNYFEVTFFAPLEHLDAMKCCRWRLLYVNHP